MRWQESLKILIALFSLLLLLALLTSCKKYKPPGVELCGYSELEDIGACDDPRRDDNPYFRKIRNGDLFTSPESFERTKAYCATMRSKLIQCENKLKNRSRR